MKKKIIGTGVIALGILLDVSVAFAQITAAGLNNPLGFSSIQNFISYALKALVVIALPFIAFFLVYSGFLFVTAQGNEGKLEKAKNNFLYVIIGAVLILGAWVIATLIGGTVTQIVGS